MAWNDPYMFIYYLGMAPFVFGSLFCFFMAGYVLWKFS